MDQKIPVEEMKIRPKEIEDKTDIDIRKNPSIEIDSSNFSKSNNVVLPNTVLDSNVAIPVNSAHSINTEIDTPINSKVENKQDIVKNIFEKNNGKPYNLNNDLIKFWKENFNK